MEMRLWKKEKYRFSYRILKKTVYENYQLLSWFTSSSQKPPKTNLPNGLKYFVSRHKLKFAVRYVLDGSIRVCYMASSNTYVIVFWI